MKHLKLFFALFAMLALGVGNAWAEDYSATHTSNVTFTAGTNGSTAKVIINRVEYGAMKLGTSSKTGTMTFKIPVGTTKIHLHVAGWKSNNTKLNLSANNGVTLGTTSITSTADNGVTGSSPFTLATPANATTSYYKVVEITSGATVAETTITIQTTSTGYRAVVWGVNAETAGGGENPGEGGGEDPVGPTPGTGESGTIAIKYNSTFAPALPTAKASVNTTSTAHLVEGLGIKEQSIYKGSSNNYLMFVENKGFLYNTQSLGTITSVSVTYTSGTSTSGQAGVYFGTTEQSTYTTTSNKTIKGQNQTETWTNTTEGNGFFQLSTSNKNVQITQIEITYTSGSEGGGGEETVPSLTTDLFSWSATTATATLPNTFDNPPTLKNEKSLAVSYSSSKGEVATIDENGNVTLVGKGETIISATAGDDETYKKTTVSYTLTVKPAPLDPIAGGVIDILNQEWTGVSGTNYTDVAEKTAENTGHSNAKYVAQCAGDKASIQLRSNNSNSGVVSTVSGGVVKRIEVEWNDGTDAERTLQIYGSNTAYTAATDLYGDAKGELLGELNKGNGETTLDFSEWTGDYKYIGFRSKSGAMYLTTITITWLPINSKVTIDGPIQNGSVSVNGATDLNAVAAGTELTLSNTPATNYKLAAYDVYKTGDNTTKVAVTDGKFIMPEFDVTISATFEQLKELDKIEVNTTNVKTTFWQGETFNSTGLVVTAYYTDETFTTVTPNSITGSTAEAGTKQVTVSYTEGDITKETKYDITVKAIANNEETPYTVTEAREIIDAVGETTVDVYVQGIVSKIVTAYNSEYGNISYNISEDGKTTSAQLQAYRGKSYNGEEFTSADDIQVDDKVVVKGKLKKHDTTYEFAQDNQLVSLVRSTEPKPTAATLPFEFDGGKDDIASTTGMSQSGLDSDYGSSPKLKFNSEADNVIINFDSEPGEFSFLLKQNGSTAGTFTVYESANGEDYTPIWSGGDLGGNAKSATIEPTLSATARYVKFEYTTKPTGTNYGLGKISIKKADHRADAGLAWNPATISLTVGDAFTPPTFSKPNSVSVTDIEFTSSNPELATVTNAGVISLVSGKTGTATITATFAGDATYKAAEVKCTISVNPKTNKVVILAEYNGQWYALKNAEETAGKVLAALPVNYVGGKLYNVADADKATIEWQLAIDGTVATFKNGENYIFGTAGSTDLKLSTTECAWTLDGSTYKIGNRTFLYRAQANGFKNYNAEDNAGTADYSSLPVVTAPVYATGDAYSRSTTAGKFGTICLPFGSTNYTGAEFYELVQAKADGVVLASVETLVAGVPYIFEASAAEVAVYGNGTTAATAGNSNGLHGTFTDNTEVAVGNYILKDNTLCQAKSICWVNAYRAYIVMSEVPTDPVQQMPGRRYIGMSVQGENEATGFENITAPAGKTVKAIVNGQLIIIRDGEMYNAQGQKL